MSAPSPAVALLFDDTELGGHLRDALSERGARIVHEGGVSSLSRELLDRSGAEVLVVNLDDAADDALDQLYAVIDGDHLRVVFNDAQASRGLAGWDRARWARHLAVKVLAAGDIDPPRPQAARGVDVAVSSTATAAATVPADAPVDAAVAVAEVPGHAMPAALPSLAEPAPLPASEFVGDQPAESVSAESESLAAELEALLASGDLPTDDAEAASGGLRFADGEEPPPLHDGQFGVVPAPLDDAPARQAHPTDTHATSAPSAAAPAPAAPPAPVFQLDHLQLAPLLNDQPAASVVLAAAAIPESPLAQPPRAHDNWALLDDDAAATAEDDMPDASAFGIEKLSAAEFLAPPAEAMVGDIQPTMSLHLVSMEEAVAPQAYQPVHEMVLGDTGTALSRIVLLGAAAAGARSVGEFMAAIPRGTRLTFVLLQHLAEQSAETLAATLSLSCQLPVRPAGHGDLARPGDVLVVPADQSARLHRDGRVELLPVASDPAQSPSIDASFTLAANGFGRDALAIVFAGRSTDAVAGAQAIHDRGGQVWVESSSGEHFADMVSGIYAERLVSFSGTPQELAAHLIEVYP